MQSETWTWSAGCRTSGVRLRLRPIRPGVEMNRGIPVGPEAASGRGHPAGSRHERAPCMPRRSEAQPRWTPRGAVILAIEPSLVRSVLGARASRPQVGRRPTGVFKRAGCPRSQDRRLMPRRSEAQPRWMYGSTEHRCGAPSRGADRLQVRNGMYGTQSAYGSLFVPFAAAKSQTYLTTGDSRKCPSKTYCKRLLKKR